MVVSLHGTAAKAAEKSWQRGRTENVAALSVYGTGLL